MAKEGRAYGNLGNAFDSLGQYSKAAEFHSKALNMYREFGNRAGEGTAYGNLGCTFHSLGQYSKAVEFHTKHLNISRELGDRAGEGRAKEIWKPLETRVYDRSQCATKRRVNHTSSHGQGTHFTFKLDVSKKLLAPRSRWRLCRSALCLIKLPYIV